ncbi:MAG: 2-phosphosulfolactate phosphatase [Bacteroidia bacterium]|nr:2-phosphosulfolactate phosphatase [Bacteroidia bacterium]MDW8348599.1 2-phosphosulfolactate phosphatase [Bacteroidia bacterium]
MNLEVCFTPHQLPLYVVENSIVVVIDILRATSSICVGFAYGIDKIYPVESVQECVNLIQKYGYIGAAERNGEKLPGFVLGNSPFDYMNPILAGKIIALTTTNGTRAIQTAQKQKAKKIVIGAFTNQGALIEWLVEQKEDILFLCAGWKDRFNLEDTLFAGSMVHELKKYGYTSESDTVYASELLYVQAQNHIQAFLKESSHAKRLSHLNIQRDIEFCLQKSLADVIPAYENGYLYNLKLPQPIQASLKSYADL